MARSSTAKIGARSREVILHAIANHRAIAEATLELMVKGVGNGQHRELDFAVVLSHRLAELGCWMELMLGKPSK